MPIKRCPSSTCSRPFKLNSYTASADPSREPGKIGCPHCGATIVGDRNFIYLTHALSAAQEARFMQEHGSGSGEDLSLSTSFLKTGVGK